MLIGPAVPIQVDLSPDAIYLGDNLVSLLPKKQATMSCLSYESEYWVLASTLLNACGLVIFFVISSDIFSTMVLLCDNQGVIFLVVNPVT